MLYRNVCIEAYGYELPPNIVSSEDIEKRLSSVYKELNLSHGRLELMSGVKQRRFWSSGVRPSEVSSLAAEKAIESSGLRKEDIGCLIHSSVCRDFLEPSTASVVHNTLKLSDDTVIFDVSNACLGFLNSMTLLGNMIELGQVKAGLIVAGETGEQLLDSTINELLTEKIGRKKFKGYFASLTIGSGAVAVVMTHSSISKSKHRLTGGQSKARTSCGNLCIGGENSDVAYAGDVSMQTDSEALLKSGIALAEETWAKFENELGWNKDTVDKVFCHQIGSAHKKALLDTLHIKHFKDFSTFEYLGNTGAAALPITMAIGIEEGFVKTGDKIAMLGIGSGLNCAMLGVEW